MAYFSASDGVIAVVAWIGPDRTGPVWCGGVVLDVRTGPVQEVGFWFRDMSRRARTSAWRRRVHGHIGSHLPLASRQRRAADCAFHWSEEGEKKTGSVITQTTTSRRFHPCAGRAGQWRGDKSVCVVENFSWFASSTAKQLFRCEEGRIGGTSPSPIPQKTNLRLTPMARFTAGEE